MTNKLDMFVVIYNNISSLSIKKLKLAHKIKR